jgi:hypothetical protein
VSTQIYTVDILLAGGTEWETVYQHYSPDLSESVTLEIVEAVIEEYSKDTQIEKIRCSRYETALCGHKPGRDKRTPPRVNPRGSAAATISR